MPQPRTFLYVAALVMAVSGQAQAIVFDFTWTGNPGQNSAILSSDDSTLRATGKIEIDASPGNTFTLSDILSTSVMVTGDTIANFVFSYWQNAGGSISGDGQSAVFSAVGNPYSTDGGNFFGCEYFQCGEPFGIASRYTIQVEDFGGTAPLVLYDSAADALASMRMTVQVVPAPATLALLMLGLGYLAGLKLYLGYLFGSGKRLASTRSRLVGLTGTLELGSVLIASGPCLTDQRELRRCRRRTG